MKSFLGLNFENGEQVAETVAAVRECGFTDPALSGQQRPMGPDSMG